MKKGPVSACGAAMGNDHEAAKQMAETIRLNPEFSTEKYVASLSYKNAGDREHLRDTLRRAGLPE